ncbi:MAG: cytochrome c oxidase subunit II [Planctomycetales bacterium]|nr:cytochrome c oxidase subunit II [Planctomycetales bacterium]
MGRFWFYFFMSAAVAMVVTFAVAPANNWWFPGAALSPLGKRIDDLFYLILVITGVTFVGTTIALGYVLWTGSSVSRQEQSKSWFSHGNHNLEVIWSIVPAGILLFISLYQMDVWAAFRVKSTFDAEAVLQPLAEVTARQFEWRLRLPAPSRKFKSQKEVQEWLKHPAPDDVYSVNDLHFPTGKRVLIHLKSEDVLHSFFIPKLRVKQDAVPGLVIPVWFEADKSGAYELVCAELCGWGHYKMKGQVVAQPEVEYQAYLKQLQINQSDDGVPDAPMAEGAK